MSQYKLSHNTHKFLRSLQQKKIRYQQKKYIAVGPNLISELMQFPGQIHSLYATKTWIDSFSNDNDISDKIQEVNQYDLKKISTHTQPNQVVAVVHMNTETKIDQLKNKSCFLLDNIQDPGNLGTILRIADWFGMGVICSEDCADIYNSKVVQASMGALFRTPFLVKDLAEFIINMRELKQVIVYAAVMNGTRLNEIKWNPDGLIVIGNEAHGIRKEILKLADKLVTIPKYGHAESLNASVAAGIFAYCIKSVS